MANFLIGCFAIIFGILVGFAIMSFFSSLMLLLDGKVARGIIIFLMFLIFTFAAIVVFKGVEKHNEGPREIKAKSVQIDTIYTATKDTTYIIKYNK